MKMESEMRAIEATLTARGIEYERNEGGMITFSNSDGGCHIFPSQTYDGKLFVRHSLGERVSTAKEALALCGIDLIQ